MQSSGPKGEGMTTKGSQSHRGASQAAVGLEPAVLKERERGWWLYPQLAVLSLSSVGHGESGTLEKFRTKGRIGVDVMGAQEERNYVALESLFIYFFQQTGSEQSTVIFWSCSEC